MKSQQFSILILLFLLLLPHWSYAKGQVAEQDAWQLNEIDSGPAGFMERSGGDPYIIFPEMAEVQYNIKGVEVEIAFSPMLAKPFRMELFWRPEHDGFSEQRKVFFVLLPAKTGDTIKFHIPLNSRDGYKQFRLDLPGDLPGSFQVRSFQPLTDGGPGEGVQRVESFYHIGATETRTPEIIIPYVVHTLQHGLGRLLKDPAFLIVWLLLIFGALYGVRKVTRSLEKSGNDE